MTKKVLFLTGIFIVLTLILIIYAANWHYNSRANYTNNLNGKKILITYYSYGNHTKDLAYMIKEYLNCDIERIKAEEYENKNIFELSRLVVKEARDNYIPITNKIDISDYDVIFVGSPVWKNNLSLPVKSFLINNDFKNKTVIPFYTFGGYVNKAKLDNEIKLCSQNGRVLPSFLTTYFKFAFIKFRLVEWLNGIKL